VGGFVPQRAKSLAALPQDMAVSLWLTEYFIKYSGGYASEWESEAEPQWDQLDLPESQRLSAMCGGEAAKGLPFMR
jgi:hypothetical protein